MEHIPKFSQEFRGTHEERPRLFSFIRVIPQWERSPVLRLGKYIGLRGPGLVIVTPFLDQIVKPIDLRIRTVPVAPQQTMTRDNVPVTVDAIIYYKVKDPEKAILNVQDYNAATQYAAQTLLRDIIGKHTFDEILTERSTIAEVIKKNLDTMTENFGVEVTNVEIRDVTIPPNLQDAIARQAEAERERRSRVILAEAEQQAAGKMLEAARMYQDNPLGLQLRWMNILYEVSKENSTVIIVPSNVPTAGADLDSIAALTSAVARKDRRGGEEKNAEKPAEDEAGNSA